MPSSTAESVRSEEERAELQAVLESQHFARSPGLAHLLSYLCEKNFAGESSHIKEYSIALDVFGRPAAFDQDGDSIVRVQANRLRKRLAEYYSSEGAAHRLHIKVPVGQYVPIFEECPSPGPLPELRAAAERPQSEAGVPPQTSDQPRSLLWLWAIIATLGLIAVVAFVARNQSAPGSAVPSSSVSSQTVPGAAIGLPVGDEVRVLVGSARSYVDRSGKLWSPDRYFNGGKVVRSPVQYIWRTQDPAIYRGTRQGDFSYDIPLKPGVHELHLHFAETFYGPENAGGGGEGSRLITISANGRPLLDNLDVIADAGGGRTADVKVFTDITPADDGFLHLSFSSGEGGRAMISAIELLPGTHGHIRPVRIVARDVPYYSNDSQWWSPDVYFKGGQLTASEEPASGTDDPELYETERWGRFSYAIPVTPGRYVVILHFIEHTLHATGLGAATSHAPDADGKRVFNVFCNGRAIVQDLNILKEIGEDRPLVRRISGLEPDAQGKLLLEFVPVSHYATISAIEVVPQ